MSIELPETEEISEEELALLISPVKRKTFSILAIDPNPTRLEVAEQALTGYGFESVSTLDAHSKAIEAMAEERFTHAIFPARPTDIPVDDFTIQMHRLFPTIVPIVVVTEQTLVAARKLLELGIQEFLPYDYTSQDLLEAVVSASQLDLYKQLLAVEDKKQTLVKIVATSMDKIAAAANELEKFETAKTDYLLSRLQVKSAQRYANAFLEDNDDFQEKVVNYFIRISIERASKLGRIRSKLNKDRGK